MMKAAKPQTDTSGFEVVEKETPPHAHAKKTKKKRALSLDSSTRFDAQIRRLEEANKKKFAELEGNIKQLKEKTAAPRGVWAEVKDANKFLGYLTSAVDVIPQFKLFQMVTDVAEQVVTSCKDIYQEISKMTPAQKVFALLCVSAMLTGAIALTAGVLGLLPVTAPALTPVAGAALAAIGAYGARKLITQIKDARNPELAKELGMLQRTLNAIQYILNLPAKAINYAFKGCYKHKPPVNSKNTGNDLQEPLLKHVPTPAPAI